MTTDQWSIQFKEYRRILDLTKNSQSAVQLLDARKEANLAMLNGAIDPTQEALLCVARAAMRKALKCTTFTGLYNLECGYTEVHKSDPLFQSDARWFFMMLFQPTRVRLFEASEFGKGFRSMFRNYPKLIAATIDGRMVSVSGRGE